MLKLSRLFALGTALLLGAVSVQAMEKPQEWELVNPTGVIQQAQVEPARRITSLDGKTVALRWNSKHNGDVVLDRIAELLSQKYPTIKIIKTYQTDPSLNGISGPAPEAERVAKAVAAAQPDLVIATQGD